MHPDQLMNLPPSSRQIFLQLANLGRKHVGLVLPALQRAWYPEILKSSAVDVHSASYPNAVYPSSEYKCTPRFGLTQVQVIGGEALPTEIKALLKVVLE